MDSRTAPGTALITGASSGIGRELALVAARERWRLVLVARNQEALKAVAIAAQGLSGTTADVLPVDLADPAGPEKVMRALERESIVVDALVNNAGFGSNGAFASARVENELAMIQVNVAAVTHLTRLLLPGMIERRRGRVLNVASTAAFQAGPFMA
ncbi:MAG: SDR family NAD(P)-dependent oxidoreductase, partial [bacterium]